jgi:hypothetical protein
VSWWDRASTEQRLEQIEAGIELGMASPDVAVCVGLERHQFQKVVQLALNHGRHFPNQSRGAKRARQRGDVRRAYWQGGRDITDRGAAEFALGEGIDA